MGYLPLPPKEEKKEVDSNVINDNSITDDQYFDDFFENQEEQKDEKFIPKADISILKNYSDELTAKKEGIKNSQKRNRANNRDY